MAQEPRHPFDPVPETTQKAPTSSPQSLLMNLISQAPRVIIPLLTTAGGPTGAAAGAAGEILSQMLENRSPDVSKLNWKRIGVESAISAVPLGKLVKAGSVGTSAIRGGAFAAAGMEGRRLASAKPGEALSSLVPHSPSEALAMAAEPIVGSVVGGVLGKVTHAPKGPHAPDYKSASGLRVALDDLKKAKRGDPTTPDVRAKHAALAAEIDRAPNGEIAQEIGAKKSSLVDIEKAHAEATTLQAKDAVGTEKAQAGFTKELTKAEAQAATLKEKEAASQARALDKQVKTQDATSKAVAERDRIKDAIQQGKLKAKSTLSNSVSTKGPNGEGTTTLRTRYTPVKPKEGKLAPGAAPKKSVSEGYTPAPDKVSDAPIKPTGKAVADVAGGKVEKRVNLEGKLPTGMTDRRMDALTEKFNGVPPKPLKTPIKSGGKVPPKSNLQQVGTTDPEDVLAQTGVTIKGAPNKVGKFSKPKGVILQADQNQPGGWKRTEFGPDVPPAPEDTTSVVDQLTTSLKARGKEVTADLEARKLKLKNSKTPEEIVANLPKSLQESGKKALDMIKRSKGEKGAINPQLAMKAGTTLAGATGGAALNPEHPAEGAAMGGILGFGGGSLLSSLLQRGQVPGGSTDIVEGLRAVGKRAPNMLRGGLLSDPKSGVYNSVAGPVGSQFFGGLEQALSGNADGWKIMGDAMNPIKWGKDYVKKMPEAMKDVVETNRSESVLPTNPNLLDHVFNIPAVFMNTGDKTVMSQLRARGVSEKLAREITLTNEPGERFPFFANVGHWGKAVNSEGVKSIAAQLALPFRRTVANIGESAIERTPIVAELANMFQKGPLKVPRRALLARQAIGGGVGLLGYGAGASTPEGIAKETKLHNLVSNLGGQYSALASAGFALGQARRKGTSAAKALTIDTLQGLPLPSTAVLEDLAKPAFKFFTGEPLTRQDLPKSVVPKITPFLFKGFPSIGNSTQKPTSTPDVPEPSSEFELR